MTQRIVVVGNGMAGSRLVQELVARRVDARITVLGAEIGGCYNRVLLSHVLAGTACRDDIMLADPDWYAEHGVELYAGVRVERVDRESREVRAGELRIGYDTLVLATGSEAIVPPVPGISRHGVTTFRTLDDCAVILGEARTARHAVVLGGGLLGLEAARGLAGRGLAVTVLHLAGHVMERQLDEAAGAVLASTLGRLNIEVITGAQLTEVHGCPRVDALRLADGQTIATDLLVLACGVRPDVTLARDSGLAVERGVVVDDELRSVSDESVYAIGECAQHGGQVYGLVAPAWEQARVLADVLTGRSARYAGTRTITRLKAAGVELAAMGDVIGEQDGADVVTFTDAARGTYQKLVLRGGRLAGAILLGDTRAAGTISQLFTRGAAAPEDRAALLFGVRSAGTETEHPTRIPDRATICRCNGVSKGAIRAAWQNGARSVEAIATATRATTGCGTCRDTVCGLVDWLADVDPEPVPA